MGVSFPSIDTLLLIENIRIICKLLRLGYVYALTLFYDKQACLHFGFVVTENDIYIKGSGQITSLTSASPQQRCSETSHIIQLSHQGNTEYIWSLLSIMHMLLLFHRQ